MKLLIPVAIFNNLETLKRQTELKDPDGRYDPNYAPRDYRLARDFLLAYQKNQATFRAYRGALERLLQWSWLVRKQSVLAHNRQDLEELVAFCLNPPVSWIDVRLRPRYVRDPSSGQAVPNPKWRPFVNNAVAGSKRALRRGRKEASSYEISEAGIEIALAAWGSFYNYLILEEITTYNPVLLIKQKSALIHRHQQHRPIRRLSNQQLSYVMKAAKELHADNPKAQARTEFIIEALFGMYLRISELTADPDRGWTPQMNHFYCDQDQNWWFHVLGKGNKERDISVSDAMLEALKRYRVALNLTPLPSRLDDEPLLPKLYGHEPITDSRLIREIVQQCFDRAKETMVADGLEQQAQELDVATVHWLRHTGISEDVKIRPREHVRDDAGHSSSAITDRYIDVERKERHDSARDKPLIPEVSG